jgi:hypothetical protein
MNTWQLESDLVRLDVRSEGGFLESVRFKTALGWIEPMHLAPWHNEELGSGVPPMLQNLRGDFFCAPFGASDITPEETRPHGATANAAWKVISSQPNFLQLELIPSIMGSRVTKNVFVQPDQSIIYQEHIFRGGSGSIPIGHHAMLHTTTPLLLGFSRFIWAGTPPTPPEPDPALGRSKLKYPQEFSSLAAVQSSSGEVLDLQNYPVLEQSEEILMLCADPKLDFAWSAATNQAEGWVWFALKDPKVLASTVLWLSNGGRDYPPFSSRHTGVIGIEEVTAYFHLGHQASLKNPLQKKGIPTFVQLEPEICVRYAIGLIGVPKDFARVKNIRAVTNGIELEDEHGTKVFAKINLDFIKNAELK